MSERWTIQFGDGIETQMHFTTAPTGVVVEMPQDLASTIIPPNGVRGLATWFAEQVRHVDQPPFHQFPGLKVIAGCSHNGDNAAVNLLAQHLLRICEAMGFGQRYELIEHPTEDVLYICVEVDAEAAKVNDLEVVEEVKTLIIPGQRPVSGGNLRIT